MAKRTISAPTKYEGDLSGYKMRYLKCRGRRRHNPKVRGHINIVVKDMKIMQFTEEAFCACGVRFETDYEVRGSRFVRMGPSKPDYSGAPGYLFDTNSVHDLEEARDELLTRELMGALKGDALEALFRTKNISAQPIPTQLRAV